jgi:tRNA dimethylallyltransferase
MTVRVPLPDVVAVVGPTSAGKSDLALALACSLRAEVVSADSMQLYRGMDIGTAKVPATERRGVPHHLLDVLDIDQRSTVAEFQQVGPRRDRRLPPTGGSGGAGGGVGALCPARCSTASSSPVPTPRYAPGSSPSSRPPEPRPCTPASPRSIPLSATTIDATNGRRIVRALEVVEITGRPYRARLPGHEYAYDSVVAIGRGRPAARARSSDRRAGRRDVAGGPRRRGGVPSRPSGCGRPRRPAAPSDTRRC